MAQGKTIPSGDSDSRQVICCIRFRTYPQPVLKRGITPIATDVNGSIMAEAVPVKDGWIVRLRAQGCALPRFKDSENVYPTLSWAEDAYWRQCEAERFREDDVIEWGHWQEAVREAAE